MKSKAFKVTVALPLSLLAMMFFALPASAADLRSNQNVIIASGDVVNDDLYLTGDRIVINGTVNGDVLAVGNNIAVSGIINGDVIAIASSLSFDGEVTGSLRAAGGNINIEGTIGDDLVVAGGEIYIRNAASIGRDLVFGAGDIRAEAIVGSNIFGAAGIVEIENAIEGNAEIYVDQLTIASTANIKGDLIYTSDKQADIDPDAYIGGTTIHKIPSNDSWFYESSFFPLMETWSRIIFYLAVLLFGVVIVVIAPHKSAEVAGALRKKSLLSLGWGALVFFVTPIAVLITFLTIIGIPLGILLAILYGLGIFLSQLVVGLFIGRWIISRLNVEENRGNLIGALIIGFTTLTLLKMIPVVGFILWWITVLFGIGAIAVSVIQRNGKDKVSAVIEST